MAPRLKTGLCLLESAKVWGQCLGGASTSSQEFNSSHLGGYGYRSVEHLGWPVFPCAALLYWLSADFTPEYDSFPLTVPHLPHENCIEDVIPLNTLTWHKPSAYTRTPGPRFLSPLYSNPRLSPSTPSGS